MPVIGVPILKSILGRRLGFSTRTPSTASNLIIEGGIVTGALSGAPVTTAPADLAAISMGSGTATLRESGGTATAVAGAVTLNKPCGVLTSESLATAAGANYTMTLTDNQIQATDIVLSSGALGTSTAGTPDIAYTQVTAGQAVFFIRNLHATAAFNGTITIAFAIIRPS